MPTPPQNARRKHDPDESQAHVHRRDADSNAVLHLHSRIADCEASIDKLLASQAAMADNLKRLTENLGRVAEVLEAWNNAKGFWLTIQFVSGVVKVVVPIGAFLVAVWLLVKTGQWFGNR